MSRNSGRQIMLDTETTGLKPEEGHRVIEIGAVMVENREITETYYHQYIQPQMEVEAEALAVHGISNEFLKDKPLFAQVVDEFLEFIKGAELVIHNAPFDVGFLNHELSLCGRSERIEELCQITDSLGLARKKHPGAKNNLDALCRRYGIDNTHRSLHGALLDSQILAQVYLSMTGGQIGLNLSFEQEKTEQSQQFDLKNLPELNVVKANQQELKAHQEWLEKHGGEDKGFLWQRDSEAN